MSTAEDDPHHPDHGQRVSAASVRGNQHPPGLACWRHLDPLGNLGIVRVGIAYKAAYAGLAFWYLVIGALPSVFFIPWAIIDLLFLVGFVLFLRAAATPQPA